MKLSLKALEIVFVMSGARMPVSARKSRIVSGNLARFLRQTLFPLAAVLKRTTQAVLVK